MEKNTKLPSDTRDEISFLSAAKEFISGGQKLLPFRPFPAASQREEYDRLPSWLREKVLSLGESFLGYSYPPIYATDFMAFRRTGNRVNYENIYFARRYALNSLVAAECVEHQGRFLDDIINGIYALCEESAWQLPPHNSCPGEKGQAILPSPDCSVLDLFACETGALLACVAYLLQEQLNEISPFITKRIQRELEHRIITPYLNEHFWWMGKEGEHMCNWTPWCTQNVLLAFFLSANFSEPRGNEKAARAILCQAALSCDFFLKDYGEDGCCDEGAQYYRHAGLCLDGAASVMNHVTGGAFIKLAKQPKIKNIASYIFHVHVDGKYYFNFADCSPIAGRAGVREFLFGKHTGQSELMLFAAKDFKDARETMFDDECHQLNLFYRLQAIFCYEEIMAYDTAKPLVHPDIYYPSVGLFLSRSSSFCLAVKSGDNNDSHNHNDVGSLTLYKNGQPILVDIGVESYTQKTFSSSRYDIWTMQSGYHNLPTIEGMDQKEGPDYCARNVVTAMNQDGKSSISMELSGAYPLSAPVPCYHRCVLLDKAVGCVVLTDRTDSQDVILNFITYEKPLVTGHIIQVGAATLTIAGASLINVETLPIVDKRLQAAWEHDLYRIRLRMDCPEFRMSIQ